MKILELMKSEYHQLEDSRNQSRISIVGSGAGGVRSVKSVQALEKQLEDRNRLYNKL